MKYIYLALNWGFGFLFGLSGLALLFSYPITGLIFVAIALLLIPSVRSFVYSKTKIEIVPKRRMIAVFVMIVCSFVFMDSWKVADKKIDVGKTFSDEIDVDKVLAGDVDELEKLKKKNTEMFRNDRNQILSDAAKYISLKDYGSALSLTNRYLVSGDEELQNLHNAALQGIGRDHEKRKTLKERAEKKKKVAAILLELKSIPASQYKKNMVLYKQLTELVPDSKLYATKLASYTAKEKARDEKELVEQARKSAVKERRVAKFGKPPTQSQWDGSYFPVNQYLKRIANDPDSIEIDGCTKVFYTDAGWLVGCDYRGRNAFGGMIRQSNWYTIVYDRVVEMHDLSAFNP